VGLYLLGVALGGVIGLLGRRVRLFTYGGTVALGVVGGVTFGAGGWTWGALLLVVVVSVGLWRLYGAAIKRDRLGPCGVPRAWDWREVLALVGWPAILALVARLGAGSVGVYGGFVGALATTAADRWATEIGLLSARAPRLIITRREVRHGTPGAVSTLGIVSAAGGAWLTGFLGMLLPVAVAWVRDEAWEPALVWLPIAATVGGVIGALVDSLLAASAQAVFYCEVCERITERPERCDGGPAEQVRGWWWLTSEGIDLVCAILGAAISAAIIGWLATHFAPQML
jgi:uncharacterized membrane protein